MGKKRATSQDVADLAGVSRTTVSLVLNNVEGINISDATRKRVREAAQTLGYVPNATAQALATQRARAIGLVMTRSPHHIESDIFLPQLLSGLLEVVKKENFRLLIEIVDEEGGDHVYVDLAHAKHIDGMILLTPRMDDAGLRKLEEADVPNVLLGSIDGVHLYTVDVDNRLAAKTIVSHLIELGHAKIACISNAPKSYSAAQDRVLGYLDALEEAGIPANEKLIRYADFDPESGYEAMCSLLNADEEFTAVFVASDSVAMGVKSALRKVNLHVPEDISLVGFDDIPWAAYADPPLTTVHLPAREMASKACLLLLDMIRGKFPQEKHVFMETNLVERESTKRI